MGILTETKSGPTEVSVGFRRGWFRHIRVALSSAGWLAVIVAAIKLLALRPTEGFGLLGQWGPWPIIAIVCVVLLGHFLSRLTDAVQVSFSSMVKSAEAGAAAHNRTADALTQLAEQGGRQAEEVRRLAIYAAREFPSVYERLDRQDEVLSTITAVVHEIRAHQQKETTDQ